eukprot:scaffold110220_cov20-Tisochrysis_lutea.AAC.2
MHDSTSAPGHTIHLSAHQRFCRFSSSCCCCCIPHVQPQHPCLTGYTPHHHHNHTHLRAGQRLCCCPCCGCCHTQLRRLQRHGCARGAAAVTASQDLAVEGEAVIEAHKGVAGGAARLGMRCTTGT